MKPTLPNQLDDDAVPRFSIGTCDGCGAHADRAIFSIDDYHSAARCKACLDDAIQQLERRRKRRA